MGKLDRAAPDTVWRPASETERRDWIVRLTASIAVAAIFVVIAAWGVAVVGRDNVDHTEGPTALSLNTVTNPKGIPITVSYPVDWFARQNSGNTGLFGNGLVVVNDRREANWDHLPGGSGPFGTHIRDFVGVTVFKARHHAPGPTDSSFPLDMADAKVDPVGVRSQSGTSTRRWRECRSGSWSWQQRMRNARHRRCRRDRRVDPACGNVRHDCPTPGGASRESLCVGSVELRFPSLPGSAQQLVPGLPGVVVECLLPTTHAVIRGEHPPQLVGDLNALPRHPGLVLRVCPGTAPSQELFFVYPSGRMSRRSPRTHG